MGIVRRFIEEQSKGRVKCYGTRKYSLDTETIDTITYDDKPSTKSKLRIAETNTKNGPVVDVPGHLKDGEPIFKYFLDGSRHVCKVDDMCIGGNIYPMVVGQIIVGCCYRPNRDTFVPCDESRHLRSKIVIAMPDVYISSCRGVAKEEDFIRKTLEDLNKNIQDNSRFPFKEIGHNVVEKILVYQTDGGDKSEDGKNKYLNWATSAIQNEMMDDEQELVSLLCAKGKLDQSTYLIKDGSLQYSRDHSFITDGNKWMEMRKNFQHVVGISKMFDPELFQDMAGIIAELKPNQRTKVYEYVPVRKSGVEDDGVRYGVWYVRLRNDKNKIRGTQFSDVVKCEYMLKRSGDTIETELVDCISANLMKEAFPVCYGRDARWANHLYPVFLTETFCKKHYYSNDVIYSLF